jgi:outer membrane protein insertion porin family
MHRVGFLWILVLTLAAATEARSEDAGSEKQPWLQIKEPPDRSAATRELDGRTVVAIDLAGNSITKDHIIRREIGMQVGDPFSSELRVRSLVNLESLGIFSTVTIEPTPAGLDEVSLLVTVKEMPWIIPYVAFKITDSDGLSIGPALSSLNLIGRDIAISGRALFGGATTFQLRLDWPWISGNHFSHNLFAGHLIRDDTVREFEETSDEFTPWFGTYLGRKGRLGAGFSYFRMKSDRDGITLEPDNIDKLYRIGASIGYDSRDGMQNPHRGWEHEVKVWYTTGSGEFWTTDVDLRRYQPVGRHTLVFSFLNSLQSGVAGTDVPSYLQYVMGGSNSIRGYDLEVLGKELYGKNQLIGTVEYQHLVWDVREIAIYKWSFTLGFEVAAFVDVGAAWSESNDLNLDRTRTGFGAGLRPLLPGIGVLRLDLGVSQDGDAVFHIGVKSKMVAQRERIR